MYVCEAKSLSPLTGSLTTTLVHSRLLHSVVGVYSRVHLKVLVILNLSLHLPYIYLLALWLSLLRPEEYIDIGNLLGPLVLVIDFHDILDPLKFDLMVLLFEKGRANIEYPFPYCGRSSASKTKRQ